MLPEIVDLGTVDYADSLKVQKDALLMVKRGAGEKIFFCSHYPVITCGRSANSANILVSQEILLSKKISKFTSERGGDVTYHGPGQLTVYPILNLARLKKDIHFYLRFLEESIIDFLIHYGIKGKQLAGATGVWVNQKKIASVGIAIRGWVSFHGFSVNIKKEDMPNFDLIRPCGMDIRMTSLEECTQKNISIDEAKPKLAESLRRVIWSKYACLN